MSERLKVYIKDEDRYRYPSRDFPGNKDGFLNDENKLSYIYLVSYGKVMAFYTVKGKVSSVNSQITNPEQALDDEHGGYDAGSVVLPSPAEDGSYGTNGDAVFFFTTEGVYVEWAGEYMLADQPLKLTTPPALVRQIQ